jgi:hypothetical protein
MEMATGEIYCDGCVDAHGSQFVLVAYNGDPCGPDFITLDDGRHLCIDCYYDPDTLYPEPQPQPQIIVQCNHKPEPVRIQPPQRDYEYEVKEVAEILHRSENHVIALLKDFPGVRDVALKERPKKLPRLVVGADGKRKKPRKPKCSLLIPESALNAFLKSRTL